MPLPPIPFAPPRLFNNDSYGDRVMELLTRQGDIQARRAAASGQIWGQAADRIGQLAAQAYEQWNDQKQSKRRAQAVNQVMQSWDGQDPQALFAGLEPLLGPESAIKVAGGVASLGSARQKAQPDPKDLAATAGGLAALERSMPGYLKSHWSTVAPAVIPLAQRFGIEVSPEWNDEYGRSIMALDEKMNPQAAPKAPERQTVNGQVYERQSDGVWAPAVGLPTEQPKPPTYDHVETAEGIRTFNPATGTMGPVIARAKPAASGDEPLVAIMGPDGEPVLVPRSQAAGKRPASTREQGRPLTAGSAEKIADFDTSLDDLNALATALSSQTGGTGAAARMGTAVPDVVTDLTGWGKDAKIRQATIDRVKQVIGKALEGGVLRKEDEYKYEKILPKIVDTPDVATAKLEGLWSAIEKRRATAIDALADAGYDMERYRERPSRAKTFGRKSGESGQWVEVAPGVRRRVR